MIFMERKSSTKNVDKGTDSFSDTLLMKKKYSTKDVDKGTDKLELVKQKVNTIRRKGLNKFEVQSIGSRGCFKLDIEFLNNFF